MSAPRPATALALEIRVASARDLPVLERELPMATPSRHRECLAMQEDRRIDYLVAWLDSVPVGHGLVCWPGPRERAVAALLPGCPEIYNLGVREAQRSRGIGTRLVRALEERALARGARRVGLAVALENRRARALYERLGYREAGVPVFVDRWRRADAAGVIQIVEDPCAFLVRELG